MDSTFGSNFLHLFQLIFTFSFHPCQTSYLNPILFKHYFFPFIIVLFLLFLKTPTLLCQNCNHTKSINKCFGNEQYSLKQGTTKAKTHIEREIDEPMPVVFECFGFCYPFTSCLILGNLLLILQSNVPFFFPIKKFIICCTLFFFIDSIVNGG